MEDQPVMMDTSNDMIAEIPIPMQVLWILGEGIEDPGTRLQVAQERIRALIIEKALIEGFGLMRKPYE